MNLLDKESLLLPCPNCGRESHKTIGWIKRNKSFTCPCGTIHNIDSSQFIREIAKVEKSIAGFEKTIKGLNKK